MLPHHQQNSAQITKLIRTLIRTLTPALILLILTGLTAFAAQTTPLLMHVKVSGDHNFPPYEYLEDGEPAGFNVDLFKAVARTMGIKYEINLGPWPEVRRELESGQIDMVMGMFRSETRDKTVDFSSPHLIVSHSMFVRSDSDIESAEDMAGKEVIVQEGDVMHDYLLENGSQSAVITTPDHIKALELLASGKHDLALLCKLQGLYTANRLGMNNIKAVGLPVMFRDYCFAVPEGHAALVTQLNEGLKIIHETGEYDKIYNHWFGVTHEHMDTADVLRYAALIAFPLLILLVLAFAWTRTLRKTVRTRSLELEESESRFKMVVEQCHVPMCLTTAEGVIIHANKAFTRILGYDVTDFNTVDDWWPKAYPDPELQKEAINHFIVEQALIRGKNKRLPPAVWPVTCKDGSVKLIEFEYSPIENILLTTFNDVTEKKRLEEIMIQSEKMISVGGLAAGMAHEINNPLAGILQSAELLDLRLGGDSPKNRSAAEEVGLDMDTLNAYLEQRNIRQLIADIRESGERAAVIVEDMLAFSRGGEEEPEIVDPAELMERALELASKDFSLKKGFDFRKIAIHRNYDPATPKIECRPGKMQQVLLNLLTNGAHAMEGLTDRAPAFTLTIRPRAGKIEIRVEDNGAGMDQETQKRIFDPFFTTKPKGIGTGLGLSIAYFIVARRHDGELQVRSKPDKGTVFIIRLPAEKSPDPKAV